MRPNKHEMHHGMFTSINPVIRLLTLSDVVLLGSMQLMSPVFALFVVEQIEGANAAVVGAAASVYLITKAIGQIPAATFIDRIRGERDDFWFLFLGTLAMALMPLLYLAVRKPIELYAIQFLLGLCAAITYPPYMAIFTRHIDRKREATEWGLRFTLIDLVAAISATLGGLIVLSAGYATLIWILVGINVIGTLFLIPVRKELRAK